MSTTIESTGSISEQRTPEQLARIEQWALALESGKYPQTRGALRKSRGFCCLGVLCDISGLGEWSKYNEYCYSGTFLPLKVQQWAGVSECGILPSNPHVNLTYLNDEEQYTFPQIAEVIRREFGAKS